MTDVKVEARWPAPDKDLPPKAITLVASGARRDTMVDLKLLNASNSGLSNTNGFWQVAACYQPFQLDIWAQRDVDRDDMMARLDNFLHSGERYLTGVSSPNPAGFGVLLQVGDGWSDIVQTTADFYFEGPDLLDDPDTVIRALRRATLRGGAHFMLAVPVTTSRQKLIELSIQFGTSDTDTHNVTS